MKYFDRRKGNSETYKIINLVTFYLNNIMIRLLDGSLNNKYFLFI